MNSTTITKIALPLGDNQIHAVAHEYPGAPLTMLNIHDDENTSVAAGLANIRQFGGRLIEFVHSGERLIRFQISGEKFAFDPNRIFSDAGIRDTLRKQSHYSPAGHAAIKSFANQYLNHFVLNREAAIIALHNTVDGVFSVESFAPCGYLGSDAAAVHLSLQRNKFDFFYVTQERLYDFLAARNYNVILQDNDRVTDDGSMSVYFARQKIPYINIEAEINHLQTQIEMVRVAREAIEDCLGGARNRSFL